MISLDVNQELLLSSLTQDVRLLSFEQIPGLLSLSAEEATQIVEELLREEFVDIETHLVSISEQPAEPLCSWKAGEHLPDFRAVAYRLRKRWNSPREKRVVFPARRACKQFGGTMTRPRSAGELDHDLWMSHVYLWYRERLPAETRWTSGDKLRSAGDAYQFGGNVPDACLKDARGGILKVIEGGGRGYGRNKLIRLHESYSKHLAYEIW